MTYFDFDCQGMSSSEAPCYSACCLTTAGSLAAFLLEIILVECLELGQFAKLSSVEPKTKISCPGKAFWSAFSHLTTSLYLKRVFCQAKVTSFNSGIARLLLDCCH